MNARRSLILREPSVVITVIFMITVIVLFVLLPAASMLIESVRGFTLRRYGEFFTNRYFRHTLYNTLLVSGLATVFSMATGFLFAYTVTRTDVPLRRIFSTVVLVPMLLPAFLIAFALILLLGRNGLLNQALETLRLGDFRFNIYSPWGVILAQTLSFFPMSFLLFAAALSAIDPRLEEAAYDLGGDYWYTLRRVTIPLMTPAAFGSALLLFMFHASAFGAPALLGGRGLFFGNATMLAPEAIIQTLGARSDWGMGATLAVVLVVPSILLFLAGEYYLKRRSYVTVTGTPTAFRPQPVPAAVKWTLFAFCLLTALFIGAVISVVVIGAFTQTWGINYSFTDRHLRTALTASRRSINNSIVLAGGGGAAAALFGTMSAWVFARKSFRGSRIVDALSMIPYALPGMVMGLGFAIAFSGNIPVLVLSGTGTIIFLNHVVRRMPYGIRSAAGAIRQIDPSIEEAAADLGGRPVYSFVRVTMPLLKDAFFASFVFGFINMMTDITAVIFLVSPRWRLLSVDVFNAIEATRYGTASALSLIMILSTLVVLAVARGLGGVRLGRKEAG